MDRGKSIAEADLPSDSGWRGCKGFDDKSERISSALPKAGDVFNVSPIPRQPSRRGSKRLVAALVLACMLSGCLGPEAVRRTRLKYNEAYRVTNDEQLLLNIIRVRYADSPIFVDLPNITSQFEASARGMYSGGLDGQGPGRTQLGVAELFLRDAPTLSYHPRGGQEVGRMLNTPFTAELLRSVSPGANTEMFLLLLVNDINDVPNASLATSLVPGSPDENSEFRYGISMFVELQARHALEWAVVAFEEDASDPIPVERIRGGDLLSAAKEGYTFRSEAGGARLRKKERTVVLKVRPHEIDSYEMREFARVFRLAPGLSQYKIRSEQSDEPTDSIPPPLGNDTIVLNMRSLFQTMSFMGKGVCVPAEHVECGIVPVTLAPDGTVFDWTQLTAGLFRVESSKQRPRRAEVAVYYRGYWFYLTEQDTRSRAAFALLELLLELQESESERLGPLLTLPIG